MSSIIGGSHQGEWWRICSGLLGYLRSVRRVQESFRRRSRVVQWGGGIGVVLSIIAFRAPGFELSTRVLEPPEMGPVTNYVVTVGSTKVCFMPPPTWTVRMDAAHNCITLCSGREEQINLLVHEPAKLDPATNEASAYGDEILQRYDGAVLVREGICFSEADQGEFVDLDWNVHNLVYRIRATKLSAGGTNFEAIFQTTPARADTAVMAWRGLITSFQAIN